MRLVEAIPGKKYEVKFLCEELRLSEIGLIPEDIITLVKIQGGLVWFTTELGGSFVLREEEAKCIRV